MFTIELPSRGLLYGDKLPEGKINLRPMGEQEERLLFQEGGDGMRKVQQLIDNCYQDGDKVPACDLVVTDRFYILFMLRIQMFGPMYEIRFKCADCNHSRKMNLDLLQDLDKTELPDDAKEPFLTTLSHNKTEIGFRLLRGKDETAIAKHTKRMSLSSSASNDTSSRYRIAKQIVTLDGNETTEEEALAFAKSLDMRDVNDFRLDTEAVEAGVVMTLVTDCPSCASVNEQILPFTVEFFRPSKR